MKKHGIWSSFIGAFAALCCAGSPLILAFLTAAGFGFLINDFILFPLLFISLGFMYYSLTYNKKKHLSRNPLYIAITSFLLILTGIFFSPLLWLGIAGLFIATIWDLLLTQKCETCEIKKGKYKK